MSFSCASRRISAAWVVNQLARSYQLDVQRLVRAGEQLGNAQAEAMRGGGAEGFVEARQDGATPRVDDRRLERAILDRQAILPTGRFIAVCLARGIRVCAQRPTVEVRDREEKPFGV